MPGSWDGPASRLRQATSHFVRPIQNRRRLPHFVRFRFAQYIIYYILVELSKIHKAAHGSLNVLINLPAINKLSAELFNKDAWLLTPIWVV